MPLTLNRILFPTDFSACADEALAYAVELADRYGATLHLLHVVDELDPDWSGATDAAQRTVTLRDDIEEKATARLQGLVPDTSETDIETTEALRSSFEVDDAIVDYADEEAMDLIVMGTHGRRGFDRLVLGSVADAVLRRAPCPVLTVREGASQAGRKATGFEDILAPIDFSDASHNALTTADALAGTYEAQLRLLFVAESRTVPTFSDTGLPGLGVVQMDPEIVENAEAALQQLNERLGGRAASTTYHVTEGRVASTIADFAEEEATDLIVMSTRKREGMDRFLVGSTTERVVRVAPCPVLTLRAPAQSSTA